MVAGSFQDARNEIGLKYPRKLSFRNLWPRFYCAKGNLEFRTTFDPFKGSYVVREATGYFEKEVEGALVKANIQSTLRAPPLNWATSETEELPSKDGKYRAIIRRTRGPGGEIRIEAGSLNGKGRTSYAKVGLFGEAIPAGPELAIYLAYELMSARN